MRKSCEARGNKRRFGSGKGAPRPTPRRGPPAVFVTCESGRERKCQREALDLLHHYYYSSRRPSTTPREETRDEEASSSSSKRKSPEDGDERPLSLEEELAMLRRGAAAEEVLSYEPDSKRPRNGETAKNTVSSMKSPFSLYDVGVRGMVCITCTLPGSEMVPYDEILAGIKAKKEKGGDDAATKGGGDDATKDGTKNGDSKKSEENEKEVVDEEPKGKIPDPPETGPPLWDPVETVRCIMRDADGTSQGEREEGGGTEKERSESPPPGSRFITRILPMQATCYASVEEIRAVSVALLRRCLPNFESAPSKNGTRMSFKVEIKRRLCSHLTRDQAIEAVTGGLYAMPGRKFSVDLSDPDFSVRVETVKSLCGISILPREAWYKNFNLAELTNPSSDGKK